MLLTTIFKCIFDYKIMIDEYHVCLNTILMINGYVNTWMLWLTTFKIIVVNSVLLFMSSITLLYSLTIHWAWLTTYLNSVTVNHPNRYKNLMSNVNFVCQNIIFLTVIDSLLFWFSKVGYWSDWSSWDTLC
jgi:hypothetical protein